MENIGTHPGVESRQPPLNKTNPMTYIPHDEEVLSWHQGTSRLQCEHSIKMFIEQLMYKVIYEAQSLSSQSRMMAAI